MPDGTPPTISAATYSPGARVLVLDFDADLDQTATIDPSTVSLSTGSSVFTMTGGNFTGPRQVTLGHNIISGSPVPAQGVYYSASPAWLRGTSGIPVAAFEALPYTSA